MKRTHGRRANSNCRARENAGAQQHDLFALLDEPRVNLSARMRANAQPIKTRTPAEAKPSFGHGHTPENRPKLPSSVLRVRDAAVRVGLSVSTLNKMRCDGRGLRFIKLTDKTVGYSPEDLDAWVAERRLAGGKEPNPR